jgi:hypothetical protein
VIALLTTIADHGAGAALAFSAGALLLSAVGIIAILVEDGAPSARTEQPVGSHQRVPGRQVPSTPPPRPSISQSLIMGVVYRNATPPIHRTARGLFRF